MHQIKEREWAIINYRLVIPELYGCQTGRGCAFTIAQTSTYIIELDLLARLLFNHALNLFNRVYGRIITFGRARETKKIRPIHPSSALLVERFRVS